MESSNGYSTGESRKVSDSVLQRSQELQDMLILAQGEMNRSAEEARVFNQVMRQHTNSYTPESSNSDTAPWQANLVESGIHNGGHQQPFFQIVASNNTQNILFDPRIRNNFNSPSLEVMRKMGTNQVLSMYQHKESHHSTQSNSAQVDPDPFVAIQNMLTRQHVGETMSRECTPCATTSSLNSKTNGRIY